MNILKRFLFLLSLLALMQGGWAASEIFGDKDLSQKAPSTLASNFIDNDSDTDFQSQTFYLGKIAQGKYSLGFSWQELKTYKEKVSEFLTLLTLNAVVILDPFLSSLCSLLPI